MAKFQYPPIYRKIEVNIVNTLKMLCQSGNNNFMVHQTENLFIRCTLNFVFLVTFVEKIPGKIENFGRGRGWPGVAILAGAGDPVGPCLNAFLVSFSDKI